MTREIYFIMVVIGSTLLSLCDSYLDIQPVRQIIPTTLTGYRVLLTTAYGLELIDKSVAEFHTDIVMVTDNSNSRSFYSEIEKRNDTSPKDRIREFDQAICYSVVYYANAVIANKNNIKEGSQGDIGQLIGEACLLRGYMRFILANLYGQPYTKEGVPETKSIPIKWNLDLEVILPRNTVKKVYTAILSDVESAHDLMHQKEWEAIYAYRFSALSMDTMESRVRLYMRDWKETYDAAEHVLVQKSTLEDLNGPEVRLPNSYTSAEMITVYEFFNDDVTSASILIPAFMGKYDANKDLHRNKYCSLSGDKYISKKSRKAEYNCTFRTREIYLNAAEAAAQMNKLSKARTRLLQLMGKRCTPEGCTEGKKAVDAMNQADLIRKILEGRILEFTFEGHRQFDLCRVTRPRIEKVLSGQAYLLEQDDSHYTLRIPQSAITANPGLLN